ncbi:MAG: DUF1328 domain-containing protein [Rhizobiales bacterium 24-66-13]|jgi:uncharacterized membrane protein YtjA (UPF0391 family)|uniref:DUF1328 domain-containing protein n=1 Tax=Roseixanthobacter finlandensis TaxID=3119922 RepID=UPI000BC5239F|nr:MAG: DUF1328 domain-containing protein [Rhizobiales bacterium 12-66-7]OYY73954.1 MAG: DUF1328 domain-containing protein [Rhizobiales bacterium 35-66-30]OYZ65957.1 MAG: DUF1328 domain-containing protein [Rhizobiales bacterium 24-66-13]HQS08279.1 DUF1328 domain-containing protein [Xanthobacteraceae bacterium]HQS46215.1 DUF1328 domain-containing protein [Xanthobacteraceae bacterium]
MLKYAIIFLVISMIAGAMGFFNVSAVARRISFVLFGIFIALAALVLLAFVLLGEATGSASLLPSFLLT